MCRFFMSLIINVFIITVAAAQNVQLDAPKVNMDTPSVEMDMSGGDGMSRDRDLLLMEKNIKDIDGARSELAAMSQWQAPDTASSKERKEWRTQSNQLKQQAGTLKDLAVRLRSVVEKASKGDSNVDYAKVKEEARQVINSLHNDLTTKTIDGDAAASRQQAAANTLDSVSLL